MNKIIAIALASGMLAVAPVAPANAKTQEVCFTKTVFGADINPPMCFAPEPLSSLEPTCWHHFAAPILVCGDYAKPPVVVDPNDPNKPEPPRP